MQIRSEGTEGQAEKNPKTACSGFQITNRVPKKVSNSNSEDREHKTSIEVDHPTGIRVEESMKPDRPLHNKMRSSVQTSLRRRKKFRGKALRVLLFSSMFFVICMGPWGFTHLREGITGNVLPPTQMAFFKILAFANYAFNPLLYCLQNRNYAKYFKETVWFCNSGRCTRQ